ncbi:SDR family oxidoreductase [Dyella sedimenti]|uniref:SDR family oxidoreductase n=1 Tax=Dyella sedimenti TaxID=2919947 RepID=UPI001FAAE0CC|nr:SDR family oxidoreductase [Dyella sedimenti]
MKECVSQARRRLMQGASLGLAASLAYPAWDGESAPAAKPAAAYPRPPFDEQSQPWPGLAGRMRPRPDHGEATYRGNGRLAGRKALITGGDSGIGRAAAIAYAREGADVAIGYLPQEEEDAQAVVQLIRQAGRKAVTLPGDIREEAFCRDMVQRARRELGGIDVLVSNAARQQSHDSIEQIASDQFDWTLKTNLYAMFWITREVVRDMAPGGAIVCTASVNAYDPSENLLDYSMTKAAIVAFVKSLAKQMSHRGIRANAVAPGPFWTPLQVTGGQTQKKLRQFGADTPLGRPGQPAELAPIYVFLASAEASYVTGQVFGASGGRGQP